MVFTGRKLGRPIKLRILVYLATGQAVGAKLHSREGKNPDRRLRSPNVC